MRAWTIAAELMCWLECMSLWLQIPCSRKSRRQLSNACSQTQGLRGRACQALQMRWCAGIGSGARVAAVVGGSCRGTLAGFVLLSYPLKVRRHLPFSITL